MSEYPGYVSVEEAARAGVVPYAMPVPGVICERCGAVVAGVQLHDVWHQVELFDVLARVTDTPMS